MHPSYLNVGDNLWKNKSTGLFFFLTTYNTFSQPYETLEKAAKALKDSKVKK